MWKYDQEGFLHLTYVEPNNKAISYIQAGANVFLRLIWIFCVCRLSPTWYNIDFSQLMSRFDRCQLQLVYQTMGHRPERNLQHETLKPTSDMSDQSQHLLHTLHKSFFLHFSCIFTFLEIIKHNMRKMLLFSSIFNIKMLHKNSPVLISFF